MNIKLKGMIFTVISAVIYGFTPIIAKISYSYGSTSTSVTFYRAFLAIPVYILLLKQLKIDWRLPWVQLKKVVLAGCFGTSATTILLYASYNYISVGISTAIHFIYPVIVALIAVFIYKEALTVYKIGALILGTAGVAFFMGGKSQSNFIGIFISVLSGFTYAFYILYLDKTDLKDIHYFKLTFYLCIIMSACSVVFGLATNSLVFHMAPMGWLCVFVVSMFTSVCAVPLFQLGIKYAGGTAAAILSIAEPITSILLGALILKEEFSLMKITGCICIIISMILISMEKTKKQ